MDIDFTKQNNPTTEALAAEIREHCDKVLREKAKSKEEITTEECLLELE